MAERCRVAGGELYRVAVLSLQARPGAEVVAVAFPPWWSAQQPSSRPASAGAAIVRMTAVPSLLVVRPDGQDGVDAAAPGGGLAGDGSAGGSRLLFEIASEGNGKMGIESDDLVKLRETTSKTLIAVLWVHVPIAMIIGMVRGADGCCRSS